MIDELNRWGCNTEDALARMLDDEEFYRECLNDILQDPGFEQLGNALKAHEIKVAFDAAHSLKGVLANLGLTPMFRIVDQIVEPLRAGSDQDLLPKYEELLQQKACLTKIIAGSSGH